MNGYLRLYDRDDDPPAAQPGLSEELPSGAATVRADHRGNVAAVEIDLHRLQQISPAAFTEQLTAAIQRLQDRVEHQRKE